MRWRNQERIKNKKMAKIWPRNRFKKYKDKIFDSGIFAVDDGNVETQCQLMHIDMTGTTEAG